MGIIIKQFNTTTNKHVSDHKNWTLGRICYKSVGLFWISLIQEYLIN